MLKKLLILAAVLLMVQFVAVSVAHAQAFTMARKIVAADELMFVPRVSAGGFGAQARADLVNDRIATIIGTERLTRNNIYLAPQGSDVAIMVGHHLLYTVTERDARANHTCVSALAARWLRNVRSALPQSRPRTA